MNEARRKVLCRLSDIADGDSKGFEIGEGAQAFEFFITRKGARIFAYENSCPHTGGPLDWTPDRFIDGESGHILCATHGALFRVETGECLDGPCVGDWLRAQRISIDGEDIVLIIETG